MKLYLFFLTTTFIFAQATNYSLVGVTPTRVVVEYVAPSDSACTVTATQSGVAVSSTNESVVSGSSSDALLKVEDVSTRRRRFVIGSRSTVLVSGSLVSLALRADTDGEATITCGGSPVTIPFRTARIAGISPADSGFNTNGWGNYGAPDFDWSSKETPVIEPQSGAAVYRVTDPGDAGFKVDQVFIDYFGGTGYTSPANAISGDISVRTTTSNTNPISLVIDTSVVGAYGGFYAGGTVRLSSLAARIFGFGSDATDTNRQVWICLSIDSGQTCYTDPILVTLPQTTAADVGLFPIVFNTTPSGFTGWSKIIPAEYWTTKGYVTVSGSTVTLTRNRNNEAIATNTPTNSSAYFRPEWTTGTRIKIGSTYYTLAASPTSRTSLTIQESTTIATDTAYQSAALTVMVAKANSTGSVQFSSYARLAGYWAHTAGASEQCSPLTVQTTVDKSGAALGRTITGRLCVISRSLEKTGRLYFIGESEPEFRLLDMNAPPATIAGHAAGDLPTGAGYLPLTNVFWSDSDPNVYFLRNDAISGASTVFRLTYSGDYRENTSALWSMSYVGNTSAPSTVTWFNLFQGAMAPRTQILANTTYNESRWQSLNNLAFGGIVGDHLFFYNLIESGQDKPCAVFGFSATTGTFERWFDTVTNSPAGFGASACHNLQTYGKFAYISAHVSDSRSTSVKYGGPFTVPVTHVIRGGSPSATTSLPEWDTDGSYDSACPADIPQIYKTLGATGNECVTIRLSGEPCSAVPHSGEVTWTPCPWDAARSYIGRNLQVGDVIQDYPKSYTPGNDSDSELMMIVKRTDLTAGAMELVMLRDSATGYACQLERPRGRSCVAIRAQAQHASGWSVFFRPLSGFLLYDLATGNIAIENDAVTRGHFSVTTLSGGNHTFLGITHSGYGGRVNQSDYAGATVNLMNIRPSFAGTTPSNNYVQSYGHAPATPASGIKSFLGFDWRHFNSPFGADWEMPTQTVGNALTFTLQSGMSSVYKIMPKNGPLTDYKREKFTGWAGNHILQEKSGPGVTLTDSDTWKLSYAYRAGEGFAGSSAGDLFAVIPKLETALTSCHISQIAYLTPCIFVHGPVETQMTQFRIDQNDPTGRHQRTLGQGMTPPGAQYAYSGARMFGDSTKILAPIHHHNGWFTGTVLIDPGQLSGDSLNRTTYYPFKIDSGSGNIVVEFGYDDPGYGGPTDFYCKEGRAEKCVARAAAIDQDNAYYFANDTDAYTAISTTVVVPALHGRVLYYRINQNGTWGPLQLAVIK